MTGELCITGGGRGRGRGEEEEEEGLFRADAVNEEDPGGERDQYQKQYPQCGSAA